MAFVHGHIRYFLQEEKLVLRSILSEGRYFRGIVTFGTLRYIFLYFLRASKNILFSWYENAACQVTVKLYSICYFYV